MRRQDRSTLRSGTRRDPRTVGAWLGALPWRIYLGRGHSSARPARQRLASGAHHSLHEPGALEHVQRGSGGHRRIGLLRSVGMTLRQLPALVAAIRRVVRDLAAVSRPEGELPELLRALTRFLNVTAERVRT